MTTKKDGNTKKHKKIFFIAIIVFTILIITPIIFIILQQKEKTFIENPNIDNPYIHYEDKSEYCNMSFRTKEEAKGCKNTVEKTGHPPYIDCRAVNRTEKERNLCKRTKEAGYPYIAY